MKRYDDLYQRANAEGHKIDGRMEEMEHKQIGWLRQSYWISARSVNHFFFQFRNLENKKKTRKLISSRNKWKYRENSAWNAVSANRSQPKTDKIGMRLWMPRLASPPLSYFLPNRLTTLCSSYSPAQSNTVLLSEANVECHYISHSINT